MKKSFKAAFVALNISAALLLSSCFQSKMLPQKNKVDDVISEQIAKEEGKETSVSGTDASFTPSVAYHAGNSDQNTDLENNTNTRNGYETPAPQADSAETKDILREETSPPIEGKLIGGEPYTDVDYDLSQMPADLVYASVYQLMVDPQDFEGKVFKMVGNYYATWYDPTARYYHYLVIEDAAACCAQGIEFVMGDGSAKYPDSYPKTNAVLEVTGVFETYKEEGDDRLYCRIKDASVKLIREVE